MPGTGPECRIPISNNDVQFLQCCPQWLCGLPPVIEMMDCYFWNENGNLSAIFNETNPMPVAIRDGIKAFDAGVKDAIYEKAKREQAKRQAESQG